MGRLFKLDPLGPSRMSSLDELNQPLAVGPVGQPFITGPPLRPVGTEGMHAVNDSDRPTAGGPVTAAR